MCLICGMIRNIYQNINEDILDDEDKVYDFINHYINNDVAENNLETNMAVVDYIFGSTFKAIKSYKNEYGDYPNDENEESFYMNLAYHAFKSNICIHKGKIVPDLDLTKINHK